MSSISLFDDHVVFVLPGMPAASRARAPLNKPTLVGGMTALVRLKPFMSGRQSNAVAELMRGEEGQFFIDKMIELANLVDSMSATYSQQNETDPIAWLHYFFGGSDWYIVEKDMEGEVDQAWGFACLNGDMMNAEYGYISISELVSLVFKFGVTVDLDFHFKPTRMSVIKGLLGERHGSHD